MNKQIVIVVVLVIFRPLVGFCGFAKVDAFATLGSQFKVEQTSILQAPNMPPPTTQDSLGVCTGFSSWALVQQYHCQRKGLDCGKLEPKDKISPLQMAAFSRDPDDDSLDPQDRLNYETIPDGGSGATALLNAIGFVKRAAADSCFPWDQFVNRHGDDPTVYTAMFDKLKKAFDQNKTEGSTCVECLSKNLQKDFDLKKDNVKLLEALNEKTYEHFLYAIFLKNHKDDPVEKYCVDSIKLGKEAKFEMFPATEKTFTNPKELMGVIKDLLKKGYPINMDGICIERSGDKCISKHSLAIKGYRKACKPNGECREVLQLQNSWGKSWQAEYDDGWVDAETLFNEVKPMGTGVISWINPSK